MTLAGAGMTLASALCGVFRTPSTLPRLAEPTVQDALGTAWLHDGDHGLAFAGEVLNLAALRHELGLAPTTPLNRLLLHGWRRWSLGLLPRLDGIFVLLVREADSLLLYRDPSGLRNLFYSRLRSGGIAFGSRLQALLRLPGVEPQLARRSLHEFLRFGDIAAPNTAFEHVGAVEAGQLLRWSLRGMEPLEVPLPDISRSTGPLSDAAENLNVRLRRSVHECLEGARKPASFLSGGIDSALLCAVAGPLRPGLTALTVGFDGAGFDEAPVAARIAAHLGVAHQVLRFPRPQLLSGFDRLCQGIEQPIADPAATATLLAFEHCRNHFDAVLDGTGADESIGMLPPRHVRLAVQYASRIPDPLRAALARKIARSARFGAYAQILDFEHPADTMIRWQGFTRTEIETLCNEPVSFDDTSFYRTFDRFERGAHFERYSALVEAMPSERLNQTLLMSGAPVRFPYWSTAVDRFVRSLPVGYRYRQGEPKRIFRFLLGRYVPRTIWDVPKHGFNFPVDEFLRGDRCALVRPLLDPDLWRGKGLLSASAVQRYASDFIAGDRRLTFRVWLLVLLRAWLQHQETSVRAT